jgi:hypothetical protein
VSSSVRQYGVAVARRLAVSGCNILTYRGKGRQELFTPSGRTVRRHSSNSVSTSDSLLIAEQPKHVIKVERKLPAIVNP